MRGLGSGHVTCGPMRGLEKNCMGRGQTDTQTDKQKDGHCNSMTELAQWADSVKNLTNRQLNLRYTENEVRFKSCILLTMVVKKLSLIV